MAQIEIGESGVRSALKQVKIEKDYIQQSISEYIWNSYDAKANKIKINFIKNEIERIYKIEIEDNGIGIDFKKIKNKFGYLLQSEKIKIHSRIGSQTHGKNGIGRLTFEYFCTKATWETVYCEDNKNYKYSIEIESKTIDNYIETEPVESINSIGTKVILEVNEKETVNTEKIIMYLKQEFCWIKELKEDFIIEYNLGENFKELDYSDIILDSKKFQETISDYVFEIKVMIWTDKIGKENSQFYFLNENYLEVYKELTKFNKKGDNFRHSIYVRSKYFNDFKFEKLKEIKIQDTLYVESGINSPEFKLLISKIKEKIKDIRKEFLRNVARETIISKYEKKNLFPHFNNNKIGNANRELLIETVEELYIYEPSLFTTLNNTQSKTLIRLINYIITNDNNDALFNIMEEVLNINEEEKEELNKILTKSKLSHVISTIKLLEDRCNALKQLESLVFNEKLNAYEVPHIQDFVEKHFWIFGEQFNLVAAAEDGFKKALMQHWEILNEEPLNEKLAEEDADYKFKRRQMDILLCKQDILHDSVQNIVVELKRPTIKLGSKEFRQLEDYTEQIKKMSMFNSKNSEWIFILVGNKFNDDGYIENQLKSASNHGEKSLAKKFDNMKIYVKTWSEIFNEVSMKHKFLLDKLKLEQNKIIEEKNLITADEIVRDAIENNSAVI